ncbi:MAG TPA: nucleotidyltransferase family protein [Gemmatimonadaceae bacterium]|nr:nucleotidyltransferase family protein [Gemmatimonadaceae bacterium]
MPRADGRGSDRAAHPGHGALLSACRFALGTATGDQMALAASHVADWNDVLAAAGRHAVLPLLHAALSAAAASVNPPPPRAATDELERRFDANALHSMALAGHLAELGERFAANGIAFMPIKGPSLAVTAYGDLSLRQFGDLDVVIHRRDLDRARSMLRHDGYVPVAALPDSLVEVMLGADYHLALQHEGSGVSLEVHWALGRRGLGSLRREDWAWTNATTVSLLGRSLPALNTGALIVYLCAHGAKHNWSTLQHVCDVYAAVRSARDLDWAAVRHLAARAGVSRMLHVGLGLCESLLAADLGAHGWTTGNDTVVRALVDDAADRCRAERPLSTGDELRLQIRTRERFTDRVLLSLDVLASPHLTDINAVHLPPGLRAFYHVVRPLRLALKQTRAWRASL